MRIEGAMRAWLEGKVVTRPSWDVGYLMHDGRLYTERNTAFSTTTDEEFAGHAAIAGVSIIDACLTPADLAAEDFEVVAEPHPPAYWDAKREEMLAPIKRAQALLEGGDLRGALLAMFGGEDILDAEGEELPGADDDLLGDLGEFELDDDDEYSRVLEDELTATED